jgi:hypothetical protein
MKKNIKKIIPALIGGVCGGLGGYFGAEYLYMGEGKAEDIVFFLIAIVLSYFLHIIIHEGGHLIFGLLSGYQFVSFRIGSLILYKMNGKYKFGKYKLAGTGGQCLMAPPELVNGMMPYRLYNMGGAILNLIASVPAIIIWTVCDLKGISKIFCGTWILIGIFAAATNGIPLSMGEVDNDGKNALSLGKNKKALYAFYLQLKVNQLQMEGQTLVDMPNEWFEMPEEAEMKNPMIAVIAALHCNRMMEEKRYEETSGTIEKLLGSETGMLGIHRMLLQIDQVFCEIMSSRREEVLDFMNDKALRNFRKAMKNYPSILRTEYAYALVVEKDMKKAQKIKARFEHIMNTHPIKGELTVEREYISDCENTDLT